MILQQIKFFSLLTLSLNTHEYCHRSAKQDDISVVITLISLSPTRFPFQKNCLINCFEKVVLSFSKLIWPHFSQSVLEFAKVPERCSSGSASAKHPALHSFGATVCNAIQHSIQTDLYLSHIPLNYRHTNINIAQTQLRVLSNLNAQVRVIC